MNVTYECVFKKEILEFFTCYYLTWLLAIKLELRASGVTIA